MKPSIPFVSLALAALLAGCASHRASDAEYVPESGGPGYGSSSSGGANTVPGDRPPAGVPQQGGSGAGATSGGAEPPSMCALLPRLKAAHSEPERRAILDQAMPDMPPDLRQQQLEMLRQQCH